MPFCNKCGSVLPEDAQFCPTCGAPISIETPPPPPTYTRPTTVSGNLVDRMIRAARLDPSLYEEVEADDTATFQAMIVVVLSSLCSGIGTAISQAINGQAIDIGFFGGTILELIVWVIWAFITYIVGTTLLGGTATLGEMLRTIGFSNSPGVLLIASFIPIIGGLIQFAVFFWGLAAMVIAVRQALDFSTGQAILTCIIPWIIGIVIVVILGIFLAIPFLGT